MSRLQRTFSDPQVLDASPATSPIITHRELKPLQVCFAQRCLHRPSHLDDTNSLQPLFLLPTSCSSFLLTWTCSRPSRRRRTWHRRWASWAVLARRQTPVGSLRWHLPPGSTFSPNSRMTTRYSPRSFRPTGLTLKFKASNWSMLSIHQVHRPQALQAFPIRPLKYPLHRSCKTFKSKMRFNLKPRRRTITTPTSIHQQCLWLLKSLKSKRGNP